jgi:GntR family transcriptional regulator
VYIAVRGWVRDGTYAPGQQIPTEPELCQAFDVSRITVRKAIDELVAEGWLVRRQGRGTFVAEGVAAGTTVVDLSEVTARIANLGRTTRVLDLQVDVVTPDEETRAALHLDPGERVQKSRRVRARGGERIGFVTTWVPERFAAGLKPSEMARSTVLELLERTGVRVVSAEQHIGATLAGVETARALGIAVGAPLVRIGRIVTGEGGVPVERVLALWRADAYEYRMELRRSRRGGLSGWVAD